MKENGYYGRYKAFVKELNSKPDQTLQIYCRENGVSCGDRYISCVI
ncbi:MAG: hypothetical protein K2L41_06885 [Muribaculaceae bacterium]|nr:hypothetical protein [Muribaculaceae bacterium]